MLMPTAACECLKRIIGTADQADPAHENSEVRKIKASRGKRRGLQLEPIAVFG
jgi:hypothetical protein